MGLYGDDSTRRPSVLSRVLMVSELLDSREVIGAASSLSNPDVSVSKDRDIVDAGLK